MLIGGSVARADDRARPEAEAAIEAATLSQLSRLLAERDWPHRDQYVAELEVARASGLGRSDACASVLANHAAWQPEVHPLQEEALSLVLEKHPQWRREALAAKLRSVAEEMGLDPGDLDRYLERTDKRLSEIPYVDAYQGASGRFAARANAGGVHSSFRAQDFVEGSWWELWGEMEDDEHGRPVIRRLLVQPHPDLEPAGKTLTPRALRAFRLPVIRERALRELREPSGYAIRDLEARARVLVDLLRESPPRQGNVGYPDELFELTAIRYWKLKVKQGTYGMSKRLAAELAQDLGREAPINASTLKDWVREAAQRGYLEKGPASWDVGPRLRSKSNDERGKEET
jgi:hypothetical protein